MTNEETITLFYKQYYGRTPDAKGLAFWVGKLNEIGNADLLRPAFVFAKEFAEKMDALYTRAQPRGINLPQGHPDFRFNFNFDLFDKNGASVDTSEVVATLESDMPNVATVIPDGGVLTVGLVHVGDVGDALITARVRDRAGVELYAEYFLVRVTEKLAVRNASVTFEGLS